MRYLFIVVSLFLFVGCSADIEPEAKKEENPATSVGEDQASIRFAEIDVITEDQTIHVKGDANTDEDVFYYILEQGESVIIEETEVVLDKGSTKWRSFEVAIELEKENLASEEQTLITFYGKSNDKIVNPNYVPVSLGGY